MKRVFVALLMFVAAASFGQNKGLPLEGSVQAGLLEGEQGSAFQFGFTGGLKFKTWTTSIGSGLDYYGIRSVPLYLNVQKKLYNRQQSPFAYISGGYHFPWLANQHQVDWAPWWGGETKTSGGLYYGAGLGYQLPAFKNAALFFAAGFSYKQYVDEIATPTMCIGWRTGPCPESNEKFTYRLRRLSVTTGLRF